jgi:hypothetical protein
LQEGGQTDPDEWGQRARRWIASFAKPSTGKAGRSEHVIGGYPADAISPYMHAMVHHLPEMMKRVDLKQHACQNLERFEHRSCTVTEMLCRLNASDSTAYAKRIKKGYKEQKELLLINLRERLTHVNLDRTKDEFQCPKCEHRFPLKWRFDQHTSKCV